MNKDKPRKQKSISTLDFDGAVAFSVACIKAGRTPFLEGQPGIGKTSTAPHIVKRLGLEGHIIITPTMHSALDLRGLGYLADIYDRENNPVGKETRFGKSTILPHSGKWLIFIDELPDCPRWEQSAFYQLLLEKRIGEWRAPEGTCVMAAGNGVEHRAAANELSSAIRGRVATAKIVPTLKSILKHAAEAHWHPLVTSFIKLFPDCIHGFDASDFAGGCTPRDLDAISRLENDGWQDCGSPDVSLALCEGNLGAHWAQHYHPHRQIQIPDPELVLQSPDTAKTSYDKPVLYAFLSALALRANKDTFQAISIYADRLDVIYRTSLMIDCLHANREVMESPQYLKWFQSNMGIIG